jgi:GNAT superfamily N-acetyltransferase
MNADLQVERFKLSDETALLAFLREAYPSEPSKSNAVFFKWQFLENPHVSSDYPPVWVIKTGEKIVGQIGAIPVRLKVGSDERDALWVIDIVLAEQHRGRGLGKRLMQVPGETYCPTVLALGYNQGSGAILRSLHWADLGHINRYHILLFPGNAAKEVARLAGVRQLANAIYAPLRPRLKTVEQASGLLEVSQFDSSFDELWKDASSQWQCAVVRGSAFLDWQYRRQPGKKFSVLGYYEGEQLRGYVVLFFRKPENGGATTKVSITDLCYSATAPDHVIDALLQGALRIALEKRAGGVVIDIIDRRVEQHLRRLGFWHIKASPGFMAVAKDGQDKLYQRANWFLTRGDSDVSIFEEPNL